MANLKNFFCSVPSKWVSIVYPIIGCYNASVGKLIVFLDTLNSLTGINRRHNRALRDVTDWSATMQDFFSRYNLQEGSTNFDSIFENIGEAKFDLTTITYRTRDIIKTAKNIKGTRISPLIEEILHDLEDIRRALINPALGNEIINRLIPELLESFRKLQDAISDIEYK